jgi:O-antigen/teichoic acid export membrane protein
MLSDVITRVAHFFIYALIARYLGAYEFGQLSLALTLLFTFQILAPAGLRLLIAREVALDRERASQFLVNGSLIAILFSTLSMGMIFIIANLLNYSQDTMNIILLVALGLVPFSLATICEAIFQGWERMELISISNLFRSVIVVVLAYLLLSEGYGLNSIGLLFSASYFSLAGLELGLLLHFIIKPQFKIDLIFVVELTRKSLTFLGFQGALAISNTAIFLMLSHYFSETEVGFYNAATQIMMPMLIIFQSLVLSAYPLMSKRYSSGIAGVKEISDKLIIVLLTLVLPFVVGIYKYTDRVLILLYGNQDFTSSSGILQLMLLTLIFRAASAVFGRVLLASKQEKVVLKIVLIESIINIVLGFVFILNFGLMGAAITAIVFAFLDFLLHYRYTLRLFSPAIPWKQLWKPLVAAGFLVLYLVFQQITSIFWIGMIGCVIYSTVWLVISIYSSGGWEKFLQNNRFNLSG